MAAAAASAAANQIELEELLKEVGNSLLNPPASIHELLKLLDKLERLLINVEQAPSRSMQDALLPPMKALISNALLRHSNADVKLSVASCMSELTRITAPNAPYNDDHMKEIFKLTMSAFEKLSYVSGRGYMKALSILDTVAKVRSCLVMLDLELDELIAGMFQHFLKIIRSNHPHVVFLSMETIMTLVINESEDISLELLSPLLASVRKDNQSASPTSWKLGEKIMTKCAAKLKPYLKGAVQSLGVALDDYAPIVASICQEEYHALKDGHDCGSREHLATKGPSPHTACPHEVFHATDAVDQPTVNNRTILTKVADNAAIDNLKVLEHCSNALLYKSNDEQDNAEHETNVEMNPKTIPRKRGRRPNSLRNPEEGYDHSWIFTEKKDAKQAHGRKPHEEGSSDSPPQDPVPKMIILSLPSKTGELLGPSSPSPKQTSSGGSHPKRGRPRKKIIVNQEADPSSLSSLEGKISSAEVGDRTTKSDIVELREQSEGRNNPKVRRQRHLRQIEPSVKSLDKASLAAGLMSSVNGTADRHVGEASSDKKAILSNIYGNYQEETPKTALKRKHSLRKEVASETSDLDGRVIGRRIKVWWPMDKRFYEGVVDHYDPVKKKHRVLYADGDEETLNLRRQRWELIGDDVFPNEEQESNLLNTHASSHKMRKGEGEGKSGLPEQEMVNSSSRRTRGRRSGNESGNGDMHDVPIVLDHSNHSTAMVDTISEAYGKQCAANLETESPTAGSNCKHTTTVIETRCEDECTRSVNNIQAIAPNQTSETIVPTEN